MRHSLTLLLLCALPSCDSSSPGCTLIGCISGLSVTLVAEGGRVADGEYTLGVVANGRANSCDFSVPTALPDGGTQRYVGCGANGEVNVRERSQCVERRTPEAVTLMCDPIPNTWFVTFTTTETPEQLELELRRDDALLFSETLEPTYVEQFPNGPDCGGGCSRAEIELTVE